MTKYSAFQTGKMRQTLIPCVRSGWTAGCVLPLACIILRCVNGRPPGEDAGPTGPEGKVGALSKARTRANWAAHWRPSEVK